MFHIFSYNEVEGVSPKRCNYHGDFDSYQERYFHNLSNIHVYVMSKFAYFYVNYKIMRALVPIHAHNNLRKAFL